MPQKTTAKVYDLKTMYDTHTTQSDFQEQPDKDQEQKTITGLNDLPAVRDYLSRIGATTKSFTHAVVEVMEGRYFRTICTVRFDEHGAITIKYNGDISQEFDPTKEEQDAIQKEPWHLMPNYTPAFHTDDLPAYVTSGKHWVFMNETNDKILMVQSRVNTQEGKNYYIWTQWSDKKWRLSGATRKVTAIQPASYSKNILQQSFMKAVKVLPYGGN